MKSSHFCKLAVTASLVMGIVSGAQAAGSNTAKVTFLGNIVDSPCSLTLVFLDKKAITNLHAYQYPDSGSEYVSR